MPTGPIARVCFAGMTLLAVLVALHALRYLGLLDHLWIGVDRGIRGVIAATPVAAMTHIWGAPIALLLGPFQFVAALRRARPMVHRWMGRIYVSACVVAGAGGLVTAVHASGGPVAGFGFGLLAVLWITTTVAAARAAMARDIATHRLLMRFSWAMTFGAVTLRLQIPIGFMLGYKSYSAMSVWLAYTAWIPNIVVVALYSLNEARHHPRIRDASARGPGAR